MSQPNRYEIRSLIADLVQRGCTPSDVSGMLRVTVDEAHSVAQLMPYWSSPRVKELHDEGVSLDRIKELIIPRAKEETAALTHEQRRELWFALRKSLTHIINSAGILHDIHGKHPDSLFEDEL